MAHYILKDKTLRWLVEKAADEYFLAMRHGVSREEASERMNAFEAILTEMDRRDRALAELYELAIEREMEAKKAK